MDTAEAPASMRAHRVVHESTGTATDGQGARRRIEPCTEGWWLRGTRCRMGACASSLTTALATATHPAILPLRRWFNATCVGGRKCSRGKAQRRQSRPQTPRAALAACRSSRPDHSDGHGARHSSSEFTTAPPQQRGRQQLHHRGLHP